MISPRTKSPERQREEDELHDQDAQRRAKAARGMTQTVRRSCGHGLPGIVAASAPRGLSPSVWLHKCRRKATSAAERTGRRVSAVKVDGGMRSVPTWHKSGVGPGGRGGGLRRVWTAETSHDPFFPLLLAAEATERIELGTGIAVAFARNPMTLANIALRPAGVLGRALHPRPRLADQAPHQKRFSMPWSHPAPACASSSSRCGRSGTAGTTARKLDFRGDFYRTR